MKHMIKWLKICALLLSLSLMLHAAEIAYDFLYHSANNIQIFKNH
jgi:hypothetical protein